MDPFGQSPDGSLFLVAAPGLEPMLAKEAAALGKVKAVPGGVELTGGPDLIYRANLELGLAKSVRLRVAEFTARRFDVLEKRVRRLPWGDLLTGPVDVRVTSSRSKLYHTGGIEQRVREGIGETTGDRETQVHVRLERDKCTISIDTSGDALTRRGYRRATGKAPLSPDLARALLIRSGWDRTSPLVDPFSGSGTIPIEAALLASGVPPGANRRFAFESMPWFDAARFEAVKAEALERATPTDIEIHGSDRDAGAVTGAKENAARAGVADLIHFEHAALSNAPGLQLERERGAVVSNPPFGHRVAKGRDLRPVYQRLGTLLSNKPGWTVALVVMDTRLAGATKLGLTEAATWNHGGKRIRVMIRGPKE